MPTLRSSKRLLIITGGDPAGIGPEIIIKALSHRSIVKSCIPLIIGDLNVFKKHAKKIKCEIDLRKTSNQALYDKKRDAVNFLDLENLPRKSFRFGHTSKVNGKASLEYIIYAISILQKAKNACLVTAPISKESIYRADFKKGGHTELLALLTGRDVTMMLVGGSLRVSLVTRHIPLALVSRFLTKEKIIGVTKRTINTLKHRFGIKNPKLAICALNPHAGENGIYGKEEKKIIIPAVKSLKKKYKNSVSGPFAADVLFHKAYKGQFDAVISMYHDQGLIPLKMVAFEKGVNLTLGLPFIRTSPDHGTGFDIAGKGKADPSSMIEAIKLALALSEKSPK